MPDAGTQRQRIGEALKQDVEARRRRSVVKTTPKDEADAALAELKDAVMPAEPQDAEAEQPEPAGILHNTHDVQDIEQRVNLVLTALAQRGAPVNPDTVDINNLRGRSQAYAACRLLVLKGICTEAEVQAEEAQALLSTLYLILNIVEQQKLQQPQVQAVRQPGIIVAKH